MIFLFFNRDVSEDMPVFNTTEAIIDIEDTVEMQEDDGGDEYDHIKEPTKKDTVTENKSMCFEKKHL
mgnify:CR=1 FL=1